MKNKSAAIVRLFAACLLTICIVIPVCAQAMEADSAQAWLEQFALALSSLEPVNDPMMTADPARPGEYLIEYGFGSVMAGNVRVASARDILSIDVRTEQVTDCRGMRVGMRVDDVLNGAHVAESSTQLYVLSTLDSGYGWSWAYIGEDGVYGVEYIAYAGEGAQMMEYTLTYVIDQGRVSMIRMKQTEAVQSQAEDGMSTAEEIASRQQGEVFAVSNTQASFAEADLQILGGQALGTEVASLIARMGEPQEIQTLPDGAGRILVYDDAVVTLGFDESTGMEVVRAASVTGDLTGPRGLQVGMAVQEATSLFRCDREVSSLGGVLYLDGEAQGEAPCGELVVRDDGMALSYVCMTHDGDEAVLEAGIRSGAVVYWNLFYRSDMEGSI